MEGPLDEIAQVQATQCHEQPTTLNAAACMPSRHDPLVLRTTSPSQTASKATPDRPQTNARRSTLKSAEEQLRALKAGDTSWQQRNYVYRLEDTTAESPPSSSSSTVRSVNGELWTTGKAERSVRVYLHHVRKTDTLPLILLAYQISAPVLRKANRLWATDSVQTRDILHLPVEECNITPETCPPPIRNRASLKKAWDREGERIQVDPCNEASIFDVPEQTLDTKVENDSVTDEEEWVIIPGVGQVEIIALPAHSLSYFPTKQAPMERTTPLPTLDALVQSDKSVPRDSLDSGISRSSLGSLVEDGVTRVVRFWQGNQGKRKWAKIGKDLIEL